MCQPQLRGEAPDDVDTALLTLATAVIQDVRKSSDPEGQVVETLHQQSSLCHYGRLLTIH